LSSSTSELRIIDTYLKDAVILEDTTLMIKKSDDTIILFSGSNPGHIEDINERIDTIDNTISDINESI
jgi:hypothetical protein